MGDEGGAWRQSARERVPPDRGARPGGPGGSAPPGWAPAPWLVVEDGLAVEQDVVAGVAEQDVVVRAAVEDVVARLAA